MCPSGNGMFTMSNGKKQLPHSTRGTPVSFWARYFRSARGVLP